jgi:hypothetical protein
MDLLVYIYLLALEGSWLSKKYMFIPHFYIPNDKFRKGNSSGLLGYTYTKIQLTIS